MRAAARLPASLRARVSSNRVHTLVLTHIDVTVAVFEVLCISLCLPLCPPLSLSVTQDVVVQGRIILGVSDGGGTLREELVRLRKYGQLQQEPPPPPLESDDLHGPRESGVGNAGPSQGLEVPESRTSEGATATTASPAEPIVEQQKDPTRSVPDSYKSSAADILKGIKSVCLCCQALLPHCITPYYSACQVSDCIAPDRSRPCC